jgi:hypothetical protein
MRNLLLTNVWLVIYLVMNVLGQQKVNALNVLVHCSYIIMFVGIHALLGTIKRATWSMIPAVTYAIQLVPPAMIKHKLTARVAFHPLH